MNVLPRRLKPFRRPDAWPLKPTPRIAALHPPAHLPIRLTSMHGMGDNLHQRALVRQLMKENVVYLDTPWPSIYHDLAGSRLHLVRPAATTLRTQAKNVVREASRYDSSKLPRQVRGLRTWYGGEEVRVVGSVLGAMARNLGVAGELDFRMPVPDVWTSELHALLPRITKPILLYRPLVERTEWGGCASRNPDLEAYRDLYLDLREMFYVISVADLVPGKEWIVQRPVPVDLELHHGELSFELLAALTKRAALVFCSPGFAAPLAQAVETPLIVVFGGYENSSSFSAGAVYSPYLGIDPITPCSCFSHTHTHRKAIDLPAAHDRITEFVYDHVHRRIEDAHAATRRIESAFARHRLAQPDQTVHEPWGTRNVGSPNSECER